MTFAEKVLNSRIAFQQQIIETLSKKITENSSLNFSLHRQACEEMSMAYDRIGILEAAKSKFQFDVSRDVLLENLHDFLVSEICWSGTASNMVKYQELARMIQEIEMHDGDD